MRFGASVIPDSVFAAARRRMLELDRFTPKRMREHILVDAAGELASITSSMTNRQIIADRVLRACIKELSEAGKLASSKRGVWERSGSETDYEANSPNRPSKRHGLSPDL